MTVAALPIAPTSPRHLLAVSDQSTRAGSGRLRCTLVGGATAISEARAQSPLKLLCLHRPAGCAWVFASTYGGGLVAGDRIDLSATLEPGTRCFLGTQASTKIFRSTDNRISSQSLQTTIGDEAVCVAAPDPITCFAQAKFQQRQRFDLAPSASLVLIDWLTSGRHASGERWAFDRYDSRIDIHVAEKLLVRETLLLDPADGPIGARSRMGRFDCFATMILLGPRVCVMAQELLQRVAKTPLGESALLIGASPLGKDGAICRIAGLSAQSVAAWMHEQLSGVDAILGQSPWDRKR